MSVPIRSVLMRGRGVLLFLERKIPSRAVIYSDHLPSLLPEMAAMVFPSICGLMNHNSIETRGSMSTASVAPKGEPMASGNHYPRQEDLVPIESGQALQSVQSHPPPTETWAPSSLRSVLRDLCAARLDR